MLNDWYNKVLNQDEEAKTDEEKEVHQVKLRNKVRHIMYDLEDLKLSTEEIRLLLQMIENADQEMIEPLF